MRAWTMVPSVPRGACAVQSRTAMPCAERSGSPPFLPRRGHEKGTGVGDDASRRAPAIVEPYGLFN